MKKVEKDGSPPSVPVIVAALSEEEGIGQVVRELRQVGYHHVLVVDGYSTDGPAKVAGSNGCYVVFQHSRGKCACIAGQEHRRPYAETVRDR